MNSSSSHDQSEPHEPRKPRAEKGLAQLTQRDLDILRLIGEQTAYRFDQMQGLLARHPQTQAKDPAFLSQGQTSALIRRWKLLGLAGSDNLRPHEPVWISLTQKGLALVGISYQIAISVIKEKEKEKWREVSNGSEDDTSSAIPASR
jgi:hypothetical protein